MLYRVICRQCDAKLWAEWCVSVYENKSLRIYIYQIKMYATTENHGTWTPPPPPPSASAPPPIQPPSSLSMQHHPQPGAQQLQDQGHVRNHHSSYAPPSYHQSHPHHHLQSHQVISVVETIISGDENAISDEWKVEVKIVAKSGERKDSYYTWQSAKLHVKIELSHWNINRESAVQRVRG